MDNRFRTMAAGAATAALLAASPALAREFRINDDITATTNLSITAGASFRAEDPNSRSVFVLNGARQGISGSASSATADDGTLNFDKGDVVTAPITVLADAEFVFQERYGFFIRGKGVYDIALENHEAGHGHSPNGYQQGAKLDDGSFHTLAQFKSVSLLDAFVYGDVEVAERPVDLRFGRQVVSWGESVFIQGGINTINPVDVTAFRRPGVQLKEGLLPLGMAYANAGVTDTVSVEAFWNPEWSETVLDGCGTFFSTNDVLAQGCNELSVATLAAASGLVQFGNDQTASDALTLSGGTVPGFFLGRAGDKGPDEYVADQFGLALRYFADEVDTEFGFYYTHLHSRTPSVSYTQGTLTAGGPLLGEAPGAAQYRAEYAEGIHTFGLSASTTIGGVAVAGELSYRPNHPVQINTNDLTLAALSAGNSLAVAGVVNPADQLFQGKASGEDVQGYREAHQIRGQVSAVHFIDRTLGADRVTMIGELGFEALDIDDDGLNLNYGRNSIYGNPGSSGNNADGLTTEFSAGFRSRVSATYSGLLGPVNVTPQLAFGYDIEGHSSDGQFIENRVLWGVGVNFDYINTYRLSLNYSGNTGGEFNGADDRDFFSITLNAQF